MVLVCEGSLKDLLINTSNKEDIYVQKTAFKSTSNSPAIFFKHSLHLPKTPKPPLLPRAVIGADPVPADKPEQALPLFRGIILESTSGPRSRLSLLSLFLIVDPASARR